MPAENLLDVPDRAECATHVRTHLILDDLRSMFAQPRVPLRHAESWLAEDCRMQRRATIIRPRDDVNLDRVAFGLAV